MRKARRVRLFRNLFTAAALTIAVVLTGCSWPTQPTFVTVASQDPQAIQPSTISVSLESSAADATETTDLYMATEQLDFSNYVFVGDSRTVGMGQVLHLDTIAERSSSIRVRISSLISALTTLLISMTISNSSRGSPRSSASITIST